MTNRAIAEILINLFIVISFCLYYLFLKFNIFLSRKNTYFWKPFLPFGKIVSLPAKNVIG